MCHFFFEAMVEFSPRLYVMARKQELKALTPPCDHRRAGHLPHPTNQVEGS